MAELPQVEQERFLDSHPDLYERSHNAVRTEKGNDPHGIARPSGLCQPRHAGMEIDEEDVLSFRVLGTNHTSFISVSNLDRSLGFFRDCLGFELISQAPRDPALVSRITGVEGGHDDRVPQGAGPHARADHRAPASKGAVRRAAWTRARDVAFNVDDAQAAVAAVQRYGVTGRSAGHHRPGTRTKGAAVYARLGRRRSSSSRWRQMSEKRIGIIMHGITGRMGMNQHLIRSILEIRKQGGGALKDGTRVMPDPLLVAAQCGKVEELARQHGVHRWTADLDAALNGEDEIFFDAASTQLRPTLLKKAIAAGKHVYWQEAGRDHAASQACMRQRRRRASSTA